MSPSTALLISCDLGLIEAVRKVIDPVGGLVMALAGTPAEALAQLQRADLALLLVHIARQGDTAAATQLLQAMASCPRPVPVVILSDAHQGEQALALMRQGAADYLSRPLDLGRLGYVIDVLTVRTRCLAGQGAAVPAVAQRQKRSPEASGVGGPAHAMEELMELVHRVAPQPTLVLLTGETGTGKTRLARLIHDVSPRRNDPFLAVNCGALSANLIESELFGHVKGAFTGADRNRTGKFAEGGRGTLLLDEVDALTPALQAKLLRAVEERLFEPVGSNHSQPVEARLIAASNRALEHEVAAGRFRPDLYYRLNVVAFHLPPLRERPGEIPALVAEFITEFAARNGRPVHRISSEALRALEDYSWPGNIRELRNTIERAVALCPGQTIGRTDLPDMIRQAGAPSEGSVALAPTGLEPAGSRVTLARTKEEAEAWCIRGALERHNNNRLRAALELGISRKTLYMKLPETGRSRRGLPPRCWSGPPGRETRRRPGSWLAVR
jgi:two-component system response regulator HydG